MLEERSVYLQKIACCLLVTGVACGAPPSSIVSERVDAGGFGEPSTDGAVDRHPDAALTSDAGSDAALDGHVISDARLFDAGTADGATPDAGIPDAAIPDAAIPDAAIPDAGIPDAGIPDAAIPDAPPPATITALRIVPERPVLSLGESYNFQAFADFDDGTSSDITSIAAWSASDELRTPSPGLVVAATTGTGTIQVSYNGMTASVSAECNDWLDRTLGGNANGEADFAGDRAGHIFAAWGGFVGETDFGVFENEWVDHVGLAQQLSVETGPVEDVAVGMNSRGDRHVNWVWGIGDEDELKHTHRLFDDPWSPTWTVHPLTTARLTAGYVNVCRRGRASGVFDGARFFIPATGWESKERAASVADAFCNGADVQKEHALSPVITDSIYVTWFDEGGTWTAVDEVFRFENEAGIFFHLAFQPQIGMDLFGDVIVAWVEEYQTYERLMVRRFTKEEGWGPAIEVAREKPLEFPRLAVGSAGQAVILWQHYPELHAVYFDPDSGWTPAMNVAAKVDASHAYSLDAHDEVVGVDNEGRGYVIFQRFVGDIKNLRVARYHPGHGWDSENVDTLTGDGAQTAFVHASIFAANGGDAIIGYVRRVNWSETIHAALFTN